VCAGADAAKFPPVPENAEDRASIIVASRFGVEECYGDTPAFMPQRQKGIWAWGTGREVALGAMSMGADAKTAVKIACKWNIYCGMGVDAIQVKK
jgi:hypothetical protein